MSSEIQKIDLEGEYFHVRFNDPDNFDEIRTPDWASNVAQSISRGSKIRMGHVSNGDEWSIQSILIKKQAGEEKAREQARKVRDKLDER